MLCALEQTGTHVEARRAVRSNGPFTCPECAREVILKQGRIKIAHFAHHTGSYCLYGTGESELHRQCKIEIFDALSMVEGITQLKLERRLEGVRPDVSFYYAGKKVAIEVQISTLPLDVIDYRTARYRELGVYLLWTSPLHLFNCEDERCAPREWEKYVHSLYFGRVFYWKSADLLQPIHFGNYSTYVTESSFYDQNAELQCFGGFYRTSKRWRKPEFDKVVRIADLGPLQRPANPKFGSPAANLWTLSRKI